MFFSGLFILLFSALRLVSSHVVCFQRDHQAGRMSVIYIERTDNMMELFPEPPFLSGSLCALRPLSLDHATALEKLTRQAAVYRYLPTFLFEKKYEAREAILRLYTEGLKDSLILGIFQENRFCGLAEAYGYRAPIRKVSVGYRLLREEWGKGLATDALGTLLRELLNNRGLEIITASTMVENQASAHVLRKNGFTLVNHAVDEDWGFPAPTAADKWIR